MSNPLDATLSLRAFFMKIGARMMIRPALHDPNLRQRRLRSEGLARYSWPARGATYTAGNLGGVPVEWVAHPASGARGCSRELVECPICRVRVGRVQEVFEA